MGVSQGGLDPRRDRQLLIVREASEVDLGALITFEGVFAQLRAPEQSGLLRVAPELGTICWPNGADIAPETLYDAILRLPAAR